MKNPWIKYPLRLLLGFLGLILLYLLLAVVLSVLPARPDPVFCEQRAPIFVATTGIHLEIVLPREQLPSDLEQALQLPDRARYVAFGWGERDFYLNTPTWADLKLSLALRALFLPSESALHLSWYDTTHSGWYQLDLCEAAYADLNRYVSGSFSRDPEGSLRKMDHPGYHDRDAFYEARRSYSLFFTCNNWVNQALRQAGVRTAVWSPFEFGVLYHLPDY